MRRLRELWLRQSRDLSRFAALQLPLLALDVLLAKAFAARYAYPGAPAPDLFGLLARVAPFDLLLLAGLALVVLASRRVSAPAPARSLALLLLYAGFAVLGSLHFVNAGFFMYFGAPLDADLVLLAPSLWRYSRLMLTSTTDALLQLLGLSLLAPLLLTPILWEPLGGRLVRDGRRWRKPAWAALGLVGAAAVVAAAMPVTGYRELALRRLSLFSLLPFGYSRDRTPSEIDPEQRRTLERLLGGERTEGRDAFLGFERRLRNVVVWVAESVGERFLSAHHPLGEVRVPNLERLEAAGSVQFSNAHVECPLSASSAWSLMTGISPPANPRVFKSTQPLPRHGKLLPARLKQHGYRTSYFVGMSLSWWGEKRFLEEGGIDTLETAETLIEGAAARPFGVGIAGVDLVRAFAAWLDSVRGGPFFGVVWNVETHEPYQWAEMPDALRGTDDKSRYLAAIAHSDTLLGLLAQALSQRGLDRDTLIVFVGDHGQGLSRGEQPHDRFHSLQVTEDSLQIPLVFLNPELPAGARVVPSPAVLKDVPATILDLLGLPLPDDAEGQSLARPYTPGALLSRSITWWPLAARAGRYKLKQTRIDDPPELYDVVADPWETHDVSLRHPEITAALWAYLGSATAERRRADPSFQLFVPKDWAIWF